MCQCIIGVGFDRRVSWTRMKMIGVEKANWWREGLTAGEEVGGGERQHARKSLIGKDWSVAVLGVQSNPLQLLLICYISSWASPRYESEAQACLTSDDVFNAPCPGVHCKPPVSIANHEVCFAYPWFLKGAESTAVWLSHLQNTGCMQMKPSCWYIRARLVIRRGQGEGGQLIPLE